MGRDGIPANFTHGFSDRQDCLTAFLAQPRFVNAFVAKDGLGDGRNLGEEAARSAFVCCAPAATDTIAAKSFVAYMAGYAGANDHWRLQSIGNGL